MKRKQQLKQHGFKPDKKGNYHRSNRTITSKQIRNCDRLQWNDLLNQEMSMEEATQFINDKGYGKYDHYKGEGFERQIIYFQKKISNFRRINITLTEVVTPFESIIRTLGFTITYENKGIRYTIKATQLKIKDIVHRFDEVESNTIKIANSL